MKQESKKRPTDEETDQYRKKMTHRAKKTTEQENDPPSETQELRNVYPTAAKTPGTQHEFRTK